MMASFKTTKSFVQVGDPLDHGYFTKTLIVKSVSADGAEFIVRQVDLKKANGSKEEVANLLNTTKQEANILLTTVHPNLVRVFGLFEENGLYNVVMDRCQAFFTLAEVIATRKSKDKPFTESQIIYWAKQLLHGLQHLNVVKAIMHRDIRAKNVFITKNGQVAKLGNFGVGRILEEKSNLSKTLFGSPTHLPPEVLRNESYNFRSETWALGVVLYQIASLQLPFDLTNDDHERLFNAILTQQPKQLPSDYSPDLQQLIETKLLSKDNKKRPDVTEVLGHRLFIMTPNAKTTGLIQQPETALVNNSGLSEGQLAALFSDARRGNLPEMYDFVKRYGIDAVMKARDKNGDYMINVLALFGHAKGVAYILDKGAYVDTKGFQGRTPLHAAASNGHSDVISLLLQRGARIDARSDSGDDDSCPIHLAASFGYTEAIGIFLKADPKLINVADKDGDLPIHRAALKGFDDVVELLVAKGAKVDAPGHLGRAPLLCAVVKGHLETVSALVKLGANVLVVGDTEDVGGTAAHLAAEFGHVEVLSYLLTLEPKFMNMKDDNDNLLIHAAANSGNGEVVDLLIKNGADIESRGFNGRTPLLIAVAKGDAAMVKVLLRHQAQIAAPSGLDDDECIAIHLAACFGHCEVIELLLDTFTGLVNVRNVREDFALNVAALNGQNSAVRVLLVRGADLEGRGFQGRTPLLSAASSGQLETVDLLLKQGANIMAASDAESFGDTAVHLASFFGHLNVVAFLMKVKPSLGVVKNLHGELPYQRAAIGKQLAVLDYFKKRMSHHDLTKVDTN